MLEAGTLIWIVLGGTGGVCVISMLGVFASIVRHETDLHDLRNRVAELQYSYTLQLARLHGHVAEESGVDILDERGEVEAEAISPAGIEIADGAGSDAAPRAAA